MAQAGDADTVEREEVGKSGRLDSISKRLKVASITFFSFMWGDNCWILSKSKKGVDDQTTGG